jgi:transposase-like protein
VDWKRIKAEYIAGGTSYRKLAEKYGVPRTTLERKAKDEKWTNLRRQTECKAEAKIVDAIIEKNAEIDDKYFRLVDKLLDKAASTIDEVDKWHPTLLKEMATTMKYLKECKGIKSDADIREQEARIARLEREADEGAERAPITVTFAGDVNEFSK